MRVTAGFAFALQKVLTALAGYVVIVRGNTFNVGDRIVMGGLRGEAIALTRTTSMEMGQPPPVHLRDRGAAPLGSSRRSRAHGPARRDRL